MAYTDEQKFDIVVEKFSQKLRSFGDWDTLVTALKAFTKTKIKNFIKNALDQEDTNFNDGITRLNDFKTNNTALHDEVDGW